MTMQIEIEEHRPGKSDICEPIIRALPEWFGIEETLVKYLKDLESMPVVMAKVEGRFAGFLSIKKHNDHSAEIHVLGVRPEVHRKGVGRKMLERAEAFLRNENVEFLQVKTLGPSNPDKSYALTRNFYKSMGFRPLEEFLTIWDSGEPCLVLVKKL